MSSSAAALLTAFVSVAWPRRTRSTALKLVVPELESTGNSTGELPPELDLSLASGGDQVPGLSPVVDEWTTVVDCTGRGISDLDNVPCETLSVPVDGSARAYFEWRMRFGSPPDEELLGSEHAYGVYRDYADQCELGGYNPLTPIMFSKGMVACGCDKREIVKVDTTGKRRRPVVLVWPTQSGMT